MVLVRLSEIGFDSTRPDSTAVPFKQYNKRTNCSDKIVRSFQFNRIIRVIICLFFPNRSDIVEGGAVP